MVDKEYANVNYQHFKAVSENPDSRDVALLDRTFTAFLISLSFARKLDEQSVFLVEESQVRQRELLAVEQRRQEERQRIEASRRYQREAMHTELHERILERFQQTLNDGDYIRNRVLDISSNAMLLLDNLNARAVSLSKLEDYAVSLNWLHDGLIRIVNLPPFADLSDQKRVRVTSLRNAMSFIGSEDLRILVPAFATQSWIPRAMEPFNLLRRKLWEHSLGTGIASQVLAELDGNCDPLLAYMLGLFHDLGKAIVARLYALIFDEMQREMLRDLREEVRSERYSALLELEPSELFLRNLMMQFDRQATLSLFNSLDFKFIPLRSHLEVYANTQELDELTGYARILYQAKRYSEFRMMHSANLVTTDQGKLMCKHAKLGRHQLEVLRTVNLKRLRLSRGTANEE